MISFAKENDEEYFLFCYHYDFILILKAILYRYLGKCGSKKTHTSAYLVLCMTKYVKWYISPVYVTNYFGTIYRDRNIHQDVSLSPAKQTYRKVKTYLFCKADIRKKTPKIFAKHPTRNKEQNQIMKNNEIMKSK